MLAKHRAARHSLQLGPIYEADEESAQIAPPPPFALSGKLKRISVKKEIVRSILNDAETESEVMRSILNDEGLKSELMRSILTDEQIFNSIAERLQAARTQHTAANETISFKKAISCARCRARGARLTGQATVGLMAMT